MLQRLLDEADARQLPALIAEWSDRSDPLRWIARALQLDLPLLIERPELVMPCLVRRTVGFDSAEAYSKRAVPSDASEVIALVDDWVKAWNPGGPWLRAVRPPCYPLEVGVVEEYRAPGGGLLRFSDDDAFILCGASGWERATGRRADGFEPASEPRWRVVPDRMLIGATRAIEVGIHSDLVAESVIDLDHELVLVTARTKQLDNDDEYSYSSHLFDTATRQVVWSNNSEARFARIVGDRLYLIDTAGCAILELATGRELSRFLIWSPKAAFSSRGLLATLDAGALRIWDLDRTSTPVTHARVGGAVELSPDGRRALVGHALVDAHDGRFLAALQLRSRSGWLEGGPPRNCFALTDRHAVQVMPRGVDVWRTEDGAQLHERNGDVRGRPYDAVCYDPNGRWFAVFSDRDSRVRVYDLPECRVHCTVPARLDVHGRTEPFGFADTQIWWIDDGTAWSLPLGSWGTPLRFTGTAIAPPDPPRVACPDGELIVGRARAPVDDTSAVVTDGGRSFLTSRDHYRLIT